MKINTKKTGFTLIEISVSCIIASIVMIAVLNIFRNTLASSQKGMAHLANMETAVIIMSNIEYDVTRAINLETLNNGNKFLLRLVDENKKTETWLNYIFDNEKGIVLRNQLPPKELKQKLGKDIKAKVDYKFVKMLNPHIKYGLYITVTVSNGKDSKEDFTLKRFIMCRSMKTALLTSASAMDKAWDDAKQKANAKKGLGAMAIVHPGILN